MKLIKPYKDGEQLWLGETLGQMRKVYKCVNQDLAGSKHLSMGITVFEPGEGSSLHNHPGVEEIEYIISGGGTAYDSEGNVVATFVKGDVLFYPEGESFRCFNDTNEALVMLWLNSPQGELPTE
nr:cupin domain-containing protein [Sedimentibacter sp.]